MARKKSKESKTKVKSTSEKQKSVKPKDKASKEKKTKAKKTKKDEFATDDAGIVVIDDDLEIDKEAENEERKAYLEEAKSQEAFD